MSCCNAPPPHVLLGMCVQASTRHYKTWYVACEPKPGHFVVCRAPQGQEQYNKGALHERLACALGPAVGNGALPCQTSLRQLLWPFREGALLYKHAEAPGLPHP